MIKHIAEHGNKGGWTRRTRIFKQVITGCGVQAGYVLEQMRTQIVRAYPAVHDISQPMRNKEPTSERQPAESTRVRTRMRTQRLHTEGAMVPCHKV